jgi:hypothetical protein
VSLALLSTVPGPGLAIPPGWGLVLGLLLVALNGFFVAAEFALVKVRPTQIEPYVTDGLRRAKVARHMIRHLDAYLSATQLGITLASLALGWIGQPAFAWIVEPVVRPLAGDDPQIIHSASLTVAFLRSRSCISCWASWPPSRSPSGSPRGRPCSSPSPCSSSTRSPTRRSGC